MLSAAAGAAAGAGWAIGSELANNQRRLRPNSTTRAPTRVALSRPTVAIASPSASPLAKPSRA